MLIIDECRSYGVSAADAGSARSNGLCHSKATAHSEAPPPPPAVPILVLLSLTCNISPMLVLTC